MVQIENKKKKKGRPSKSDLPTRRPSAVSDSPAKSDTETRRSLRRRTFRYNIIDYDEDYLDDDELFEQPHEDEDDEDDPRREKKVKLVVKLNSTTTSSRGGRKSAAVNRSSRVKRAESDNEDDEDEREVKKRRIHGRNEDDDDVDDDAVNEDDQGREVKEERTKGHFDDDNDNDNVAGTPRKERERIPTPLPDIKQLELILDKLQKKDTYGVYAEPVDPDELPDYHEVIEHPMDFSTVRKKLADSLYSTLEEFESDVFLISSNAMQYNASDTVYHKQARTIKELAEKKFQRVRTRIERLEREPKLEGKSEPKSEPKSEQKDRPSPVVKKQMRKSFCHSTQQPIGSDFSSGATLATMDAHNSCGANTASNHERPSVNDGPIEGVSSLADNITEKAEDPQSGKIIPPKFGKRTFLVDENRRATYNISNQPVDRPASIFTAFEGDKKQLIPVGLSGEYSFARSLARFTANLGPMAWKVASKSIEQVLSPGVKYGRGWIGEYEPLPTGVLVVERQKDPFVSKSNDFPSSKHEKLSEGQTVTASPLVNQNASDGKFAAMFHSGGAKPPITPQQHIPVPGSSGGPANMMLKRVESNYLNGNNQKNSGSFQQQSRLSRDSVCAESNGVSKVEPSSPSIPVQKEDKVPKKQHGHVERGGRRTEPHFPSVSNQKTEIFSQKQPHYLEMSTSTPIELVPISENFFQSLPFKQPVANGGAPEGLANGKITNSFVDSNRVCTTSSGLMSPQQVGSTTAFSPRQEQDLSDPVLVMRMLTEKAQRQQNGEAHAHSLSQGRPSAPSPKGNAGGAAAAAAASAWMSAGAAGYRPPAQNSAMAKNPNPADSLCNGSRMFYPRATQSRVEYPVPAMMHFQPQNKGMPFQAFAPRPLKVSNEPQVQNRSMGFPQMVANDLVKSPAVQTPMRGRSPHTQQKPRQGTLPPDLNVAFQSSVDSQQPDLALQL